MIGLKQKLIAEIDRTGPMTVADYMTRCLLDPAHGYYTNAQPFGPSGDFITAPEVSQMFGELLGLCLAQSWIEQGKPDKFLLVELGPGRGTLMGDLLRAVKSVPGFLDAAELWLVEASPTLREVQTEALAMDSMNFAQTVDQLPDQPIFLIANEFFDCLPIRQFRKTDLGWQEQMVGAADGELGFVLGPAMPEAAIPDWARSLPNGAMIETSPAAAAIAEDLARRIGANGGTALIFDYGAADGNGDTLQALKAHKKRDPLEEPGKCDLTAHVNFADLARAAAPYAAVSQVIPQGELLHRLGIGQRAQALIQNSPPHKQQVHINAYHRLTDPDQMGQLFKAIAIYPNNGPVPPGFDA